MDVGQKDFFPVIRVVYICLFWSFITMFTLIWVVLFVYRCYSTDSRFLSYSQPTSVVRRTQSRLHDSVKVEGRVTGLAYLNSAQLLLVKFL